MQASQLNGGSPKQIPITGQQKYDNARQLHRDMHSKVAAAKEAVKQWEEAMAQFDFTDRPCLSSIFHYEKKWASLEEKWKLNEEEV